MAAHPDPLALLERARGLIIDQRPSDESPLATAERDIREASRNIGTLVEAAKGAKWRLENLLALLPAGRPERAQIEQDLADLRAALDPFPE